MEPEDKPKMLMNNDGGTYVNNRAARRNKELTDNWYTKATHKIKKIRSKNAKSKQQRKRELARARKARKESYSEESQG